MNNVILDRAVTEQARHKLVWLKNTHEDQRNMTQWLVAQTFEELLEEFMIDDALTYDQRIV